MDSLTHIVLGAALAQSLFAKKLTHPRAFLIGALAATFPDFDVFLHTGNVMRDHALHRSFMHSLLLIPLISLLATLPFLLQKSSRPLFKTLYLAALIANLSHPLLDSLTSYGTMLFWPFSDRRVSLDIIAVIDPLYTLPLILGVLIALKRKAARPAAIGLALSCLYLLFAVNQHALASRAQQHLLTGRHVDHPVNPRVLPQIGSTLAFRSIYIDKGKIVADALRVLPFTTPVYKQGTSTPLVTDSDLAAASPAMLYDFESFTWFTDGYVARSPDNPLLLGDLRYTTTAEGNQSVWGLQLEQTEQPLWQTTFRWSYTRHLLADVFFPKGYRPASQLVR